MNNKVELLAPAGSPEAFYGAINAGADAVYLAGNQYGARAYAENFSQGELIRCLRYAHVLGKKVYLTVNTLVTEKELEELPSFIRPFYDEGLDGVIIQDFGVLSVLRSEFPGLSLHASTQMSVTGKYGAELLKQAGITRIVPARELSLDEIRSLKQESGLEIECFIHGAMCYSYSGQCLFSSILGARSGNRGRCAQPCRLPYQIQDGNNVGKECYPLSLKDMCTIEILPELIEAGIDSFKIEGRMKKPEYAAGVTGFYRKYVDLYYENRFKKPSLEDLTKLNSLYIRSERGTGYYHEKNGRDMITLNSPAYQSSSEELLQIIREEFLTAKKKLPVGMEVNLNVGKPAGLTLFCALEPAKRAKVFGDVVESALKAPITRENVLKQLKKLGDSPFVLADSEGGEAFLLDMDENAFYPLKSLNDLRRMATEALEEVILRDRK